MTDASSSTRPAHAAGRLTRDQASARADHVVNAALLLVAKNGYQATRTHALAREAGMAKPTLRWRDNMRAPGIASAQRIWSTSADTPRHGSAA